MCLFQRPSAAGMVSVYDTLLEKDPAMLHVDPTPVYVRRKTPESVPIPRLMRTGDIPKIAKEAAKGLEGDPLERYLLVSPEEGKRLGPVKVAERALGLVQPVRRKKAYVIDDGDAYICYSDPKDTQTKLDRFIQKIVIFLIKKRTLFYSAEQKKRFAELQTGMRNTISDALGDRKGIMLSLDQIHTIPEKQGRGYGTALGRILTFRADLENRPAWLASSNVAVNTKFYNNLGFKTVAEVSLGKDNPTWKEEPVPIAIMVREPRQWRPREHEASA